MENAPLLALRAVVQFLGAADAVCGFAVVSKCYHAVARGVVLHTVRTASAAVAERCLRLWPSIREVDLVRARPRPFFALFRGIVAVTRRWGAQRAAESTPAAEIHSLAPLLRHIRAMRMNDVKGRFHIAHIFAYTPELEEFEARTAHEGTLQLRRSHDAIVPPLRVFRANGLVQHSDRSLRRLIASAAPTLARLCVAAQPNMASGVLYQLRASGVAPRELVLGQSGTCSSEALQFFLEEQGHCLEWLDLSHCGDLSHVLWSTWRRAPGAALPVRTLVLDGCTLGHHLPPALRQASALHTISLRGCRNVTDATVAAVAAAAAASLVHCDVTGTAVTTAGVRGLTARCCRLQSLCLDSCRSVSRELRRGAREGTLVAVPAPAPARETLASNQALVHASDAQGVWRTRGQRGRRKRSRAGVRGVPQHSGGDSEGEWVP